MQNTFTIIAIVTLNIPYKYIILIFGKKITRAYSWISDLLDSNLNFYLKKIIFEQSLTKKFKLAFL